MHRPWLSVLSSMTDADDRFERDQDFVTRCSEVAFELYQTLKPEIAALRQVPSDCLSLILWDLCNCAAWLLHSIESCPSCIEDQCIKEASDLYKLAKYFLRYNAAAESATRKLFFLVSYIESGVGAGKSGQAS